MRIWIAVAAVAALLLAGCSGGSATETASAPKVSTSDPWVRTTDGAEDQTMTAVYVSLTNPTSEDVTLTGADCGDVAEEAQLHEMVTVDGQMMMQETEEGLIVPKESHLHLAPGGPHIMLVGLTRELPTGSEEITCALTLSNDQTLEIIAPVKEFTEETATYHTHAPTPSAEES